MKTTTPTNILDLLDQGVSSPTKIASKLGISTQATHRHLKQLINAGFVKKEGGAPRTTYIINCEQPHSRIENDYIYAKETILPIFLKKFNKLKIDKDSRNNPSHDFMIKSSAVFSSKIEGISLDLNSFMQDKRLLDRHTKKEITEVEDLVESYAYAERHRLNQNNFLKSHQLLSKHIVSPTRRGSYRREPIGVFSKEGLVYLAIEDILVADEMKKLFNIINHLLLEKCSTRESIFWSSWLHLELALIHPFLDGNGRSARLLEKWFLAQKEGVSIWTIQTEEYYFKNRDAYYKNLKLGNNYWDVTLEKSLTFIEMLFHFLFKK